LKANRIASDAILWDGAVALIGVNKTNNESALSWAHHGKLIGWAED